VGDTDLSTSSRRYRRLRPGPGLSREEVAADQRTRLQRATIEIVATQGYEALTVRRLTKRARVSSGTFYGHYRTTDECFLAAFDLVCRRASKRLLSAGREEMEPRSRLVRAIDRLFQDSAADPQVATFSLRSAPAAGPAFVGDLRISAKRLGLALNASLAINDGPQLPPPLLEGIVAGLARIGRTRLDEDERAEVEREEVAAAAADWIMSLCAPVVRDVKRLLASVESRRAAGPPRAGWLVAEELRGDPGDERAMILAAAFRLSKRGYHQLTIPRICREAGVARRDFNRHFESLEDCFLSAIEERVVKFVTASVRQEPEAGGWSATLCAALEELRRTLEADGEGARVVFLEILAAGTRGVECRDRLISKIAQILCSTAPAGHCPSMLAAEASTAAAWAILERQAEEEGFEKLGAALALLAFGPAINAAPAR